MLWIRPNVVDPEPLSSFPGLLLHAGACHKSQHGHSDCNASGCTAPGCTALRHLPTESGIADTDADDDADADDDNDDDDHDNDDHDDDDDDDDDDDKKMNKNEPPIIKSMPHNHMGIGV